MNKLICPECNYVNEPERVYCHSCGVKLDRSILPENQPAQAGAKPRPLKKRRVSTFSFGAFLGKLIRLVLGSAVVAALILMALPPEEVPEVSEEASMSPPMILMDLQASASTPGSARRVYTEDQINAYLKAVIKAKSKPEGFLEENFRFGRVYSQMFKDEVLIGVSQEIFGYPLYAATRLRPEIAGGALIHEILGGYIGRLQIPQLIMRPLAPLMFGNVRQGLSQEIAVIEKANSIVIEEEKAGVFYKQPGR